MKQLLPVLKKKLIIRNWFQNRNHKLTVRGKVSDVAINYSDTVSTLQECSIFDSVTSISSLILVTFTT